MYLQARLSLVRPLFAQAVPVEQKPLQCNHSGCVFDASAFQKFCDLVCGDHKRTNVFALLFETEQAAGGLRVYACAKAEYGFARTARRHEICPDRLKGMDSKPGFFLGLALKKCLWRFAILDDPGDDFD